MIKYKYDIKSDANLRNKLQNVFYKICGVATTEQGNATELYFMINLYMSLIKFISFIFLISLFWLFIV
jgi:hypothetical protein